MNLRRLNIAEMLGLSKHWTSPTDPAHKALLATAETASLMPRLLSAHQGLLNTQTVADPRGAVLEQQLEVLDAEHDDVARGLDALLVSLSYLASDPEERAVWQRLRQVLFPAGLAFINMALSAEAGNALLISERLKSLGAEDKKRLEKQKIGTRTMREVIDRFLAVAKEIGHKDKERQALIAVPAQAGLRESRFEWVRVVSGMYGMAEMAGMPDSLVAHFITPLREAEARGARRSGGRDAERPTPAGSDKKPEPKPQ